MVLNYSNPGEKIAAFKAKHGVYEEPDLRRELLKLRVAQTLPGRSMTPTGNGDFKIGVYKSDLHAVDSMLDGLGKKLRFDLTREPTANEREASEKEIDAIFGSLEARLDKDRAYVHAFLDSFERDYARRRTERTRQELLRSTQKTVYNLERLEARAQAQGIESVGATASPVPAGGKPAVVPRLLKLN